MIPFTRRQLRHTACVTLFAWMFALLSGVANACLTQPDAQAGLGSSSSRADLMVEGTAGLVTRRVEQTRHQGAHEDDGVGHHSAEEGCLKFCADESSAVTKSRAPQADVPGSAFMVSVQWPSAAPVATASAWAPVERPASVGPPLFIRLLRLTI